MASNVGKGNNKFVPAQSQEVGLMQPGGSLLGRTQPVQQQSVLAERPMNIMKPQQMGQGNAPRGAQEIRVVGMAPQAPNSRLAAQALPPAPLPAPAPAPQLGNRPQMQPVLGLSGPGEETHSVEVIGEGPDGREYAAPFDVVFPKGSKIMGIRKIQ